MITPPPPSTHTLGGICYSPLSTVRGSPQGDVSIANIDGNIVGFSYIDASGENQYISINLANVDLSDPNKLINVIFHETTNFDSHSANEQTAINRGDTAAGIWDLKNFGNENTNTMTGAEWLNNNSDSLVILSGNTTLVNNVVNTSLGNGQGAANPALLIPVAAAGIETTYINSKRLDGETYDQAKARLQAEGDKLLIISEFPGKVIGEAASYLVAGMDGLYRVIVGDDGTPIENGLVWIGSSIDDAKQNLISAYPEQKNLIESSFGATGTAVDWTVVAGTAKLASKGVTASKGGAQAYKHSYKYADRIRVRAIQDPVSHNFPYSFDDAILSTNPISKNNGYKIFQQQGLMNGKSGVFEIGVTENGIIDHRFFRPLK